MVDPGFSLRGGVCCEICCVQRLSIKPLLYCNPQLAVGLWKPKVLWGEAESALFFRGQRMLEGAWVSG